MKTRKVDSALASVVVLIAAASAATHAATIADEPFGSAYTQEAVIDSQTAQGNGLTGTWTTTGGGTDRHYVASSGLGYYTTGQVLQTSGGSANVAATSTDERISQTSLAAYTGTSADLYISGIVSAPAGGSNGGGFAMFQLLDNVTDLPPGTFGVQFGVNQGDVRIRTRTTGNVANTDFTVAGSFTPTQNMFFVMKVEQNVSGPDDRISVWLNPTNLISEGDAGSATFTTLGRGFDQAVGTRAVDTLGFRSVNFSGDSWVGFDEFRFGGSWEDVTPHDASIAIKASADAFVQGNSGGSGTSQLMRVKNAASLTFSRKVYSKFDLTGINPNFIKDARLSLTMDRDGGSADPDQSNQWVFNVFGLDDGDAGEGWTEAGINWGNAPANDTSSRDGVLSNASLLGQFTVTGSERMQLMLTADDLPGLVDFLRNNLDGLATLIVTRDTLGDTGGTIPIDTVHAIRAREYDIANGTDFAMTLLVTIPSPAALPAGLVLVGLCAIRRRRTK